MLSERFDDLLFQIGNPELEHPIFYRASVGIRFEIGSGGQVYLEGESSDTMTVNPEYVSSALERAKAIYTALPHTPDILRIDTYPGENNPGDGNESVFSVFQGLLSVPHEKRGKQVPNDYDGEDTVLQLYWDLHKMDFSPDALLQEIIKADLGGISSLASNVYFANTEDVYLYHIYDDRGADLVAESKETLCLLYHKFNQWILDYDRERVDKIFAE